MALQTDYLIKGCGASAMGFLDVTFHHTQLPLTLANWMTAMWSITVIRSKELSVSNAAKAAGHAWVE